MLGIPKVTDGSHGCLATVCGRDRAERDVDAAHLGQGNDFGDPHSAADRRIRLVPERLGHRHHCIGCSGGVEQLSARGEVPAPSTTNLFTVLMLSSLRSIPREQPQARQPGRSMPNVRSVQGAFLAYGGSWHWVR